MEPRIDISTYAWNGGDDDLQSSNAPDERQISLDLGVDPREIWPRTLHTKGHNTSQEVLPGTYVKELQGTSTIPLRIREMKVIF